MISLSILTILTVVSYLRLLVSYVRLLVSSYLKLLLIIVEEVVKAIIMCTF